MNSINFNPVISLQSKSPMLCQRYWESVYEQNCLINIEDKCKVSNHSGLVTVNKYLNGLKSFIKSGSQKMPINHSFKGTVNELIKKTDIEFKILKPTKNKLTLTRGINKVQDQNSPEFKLIQKQKQLKAGDVFVMRGYAYAGPNNKDNPYINNSNVSIIYLIDVPKNARLSCDRAGEFIFPRYSKFEVTENKKLDNGLNIIKIKYILPND